MKNLSAFPRFPLREALMILITLVVYLAGITKAEVNTNYRKQNPNLQKDENFLIKEASFMKKFPDTSQASEMRGHELQEKHFFNLNKFPESFIDRPKKRQSDYFGDSNDSDSEKENDGYDYDDDEYYHFNYKRHDESNKKLENSKSENKNVEEAKEKDSYVFSSNSNHQSQGVQKNEIKKNNDQSIELLNFQESHPVVSQDDHSTSFHNVKPFTNMGHPKPFTSNSVTPLSGIDFKENSAINENGKERKEEEALSTSDIKTAETKKGAKVTDEKNSSKLKDLKVEEDSEKKDKMLALKDEKDSIVTKSMKDTSKTTEEKEKAVKLSNNAKLNENLEKISTSKNKDNESVKLNTENKGAEKFNKKLNSDMFNANELLEIPDGASFVGNDYKDNLDVLKSIRSEGDEKRYEEFQDNEKNLGFKECTEDAKESQEKLKEKHVNALKADKIKNFEFLNKQPNLIKSLQITAKPNSYSKSSTNNEFQSLNTLFKRREPWRDPDKITSKLGIDYQTGQQFQHHMRQEQIPQTDNLDAQIKHNLINMPPNELENTEYHKNYIKSLKKYKALSENSKNTTIDSGLTITPGSINIGSKNENKKKRRSKQKKRRTWSTIDKNLKDQKKSLNENNGNRNQKRKAFIGDNSFSDHSEKFLTKKPYSSQPINGMNIDKEETNVLEDKKYFEPWISNRQARKSPQKLEYEIKIINQNTRDLKNAKFSHFLPNRLKKEVKMKLGNEGKYLKKYPYSQVSRDDLMKMSERRELGNEKKFKRKASVWTTDDQKSDIQTRAVPSGYYSNRVKFGQRSNVKNAEKGNSDSSNESVNRFSPAYFSQMPSEGIKNNVQTVWENKRPNFKHEPSKRFDESEILNNGNLGNSLLLIKKGERMAKFLQKENPSKSINENESNSGYHSKIISDDKNYVFFKEPDSDKLKKNSETGPFSMNLNDLGKPSYAKKNFPILDSSSTEILSNEGWSIPLKSLHVRSSHSEKNDQKLTSAFQSTSPNSNLRKAIDKFRDVADFFKDNEQETTDNRYSNQEAKEGTDIVFSQDKLPDPIIISNEENNKENFKHEPMNSIFAISNNFKNMDEQTKKFDSTDTKGEISDSAWKPGLKRVFPEAKSINSIVKNGNEIIVLDLNGNQLKHEHNHSVFKGPPKEQSRRTTGSSSRLFFINPDQYLNSKKQDITQSEIPLIKQSTSNLQASNQDKILERNKMNMIPGDRAVAIIKSSDNESEIPGSFQEISELPDILKTIMIAVPQEIRSDMKLVNRKSLNENLQNEALSQNDEFHQDFGKPSETKTKKEIVLSPKGFLQQPVYSESSMSDIKNILQSLLNPVRPASINANEITFDSSRSSFENPKSDQQFQNLVEYQPDTAKKQLNQWFTQETAGDSIPFNQELWRNDLKPVQEINNILRLNSGSLRENNNENKLRKELAEASEKIHRLRREGMEAGKLKKTIENALTFKKVREAGQSKEFSDPKKEDQDKKYTSHATALKLDDKASVAEETEDKNKYQGKEVEMTKEDSEADKSSKSDYENHLSELFENLSANKNQKNSNENSWNRKKRMDKSRRKRFSQPDVSKKVSKNEVQNKILKRLVEDNYRSVYSPGIKRRLLSTGNEMEDENSNSIEHKHVKNFNAGEIQQKNAADIDPMIAKIFSYDGSKAEKNRTRRSLTSSFHSNFKREIDLDESMPNDFQNFLVTSLGGFGSQKREVVKKGEALWEGKEISQDNFNQIAENRKESNGDSALEKREVPSNENLKTQDYKNPGYFGPENEQPKSAVSTSVNHADKNIRPDDTATIKLKPAKFADENLPTQIRIQISNTSKKQKKSSKPIMDENETTSTDIENLPKEKEFFDKNKINPFLPKNYLKLQRHPEVTYPGNEFNEISKNSGFKRKPLRPSCRDERIRKKCTGENSFRIAQNFTPYSQNTIESLLQNQQPSRESNQIAQKVSMITGLPQVETVYNPTQGANKAQIDSTKFAKTNTIKNKGLLNTKNSLRSNKGPSYSNGNLKSYFKEEQMKPDKGIVKENIDSEWQVNLERDSFGGGSIAMKSPMVGESASFSSSNMHPVSSNDFQMNNQKWFQNSNGNLMYRNPSNVMNSQMLYDVMKLKQHMKNQNAIDKENFDLKQVSRPFSYGNEAQENLPKNKSPLPGVPNWLDNPNYLDFSMNKRPFNDFFENKNYGCGGGKTQNSKDVGSLKHTYSFDGTPSKNFFEKPTMDATQLNSGDSSKDTADYIEGLEEEYPEVEMNSEPQTDDGLYKNPKEKNKAQGMSTYHHFYNYKHFKKNLKDSELDNNLNNNEKEFHEEYEESDEEEDPEDYSHTGFKKEVEPEATTDSLNNPELQNGFLGDLNSKYYNHYNRDLKSNNFEDTRFNSNVESKSHLAVPTEELKSETDPTSGSNEILRKANEKLNIFGKNLVKKLYGPVDDDIFNRLDKFQNEKSLEGTYPMFGNKLRKRKSNLRLNSEEKHKTREIENQVLYEPKSLVSDNRVLTPSKVFLPASKRMVRQTYYRPPAGNAFNAEFTSGENDFDHELEEHEIHFNDNFASLEKYGISQNEKNFEDLAEKNNHNEESENNEDVEENLENSGEDNVLENIIGKYIIRKRVKSSTDIDKTSEKITNLKDSHKLRKRSVEMQNYNGQASKILRKRLSSGHLTENNFRKYHKKNLAKKRHVDNLISNSYTFTALLDDNENGIRKEKTKDQMKRSALNIFKKITNKEKDNKRLENSDSRAAGFEPLLSLNDKSKGFAKESKNTISFQEKQLSKVAPQMEMKNGPPELKAHYPNEGQRSRAQLADRKKGKAKESDQVPLNINAQGPWKVDLDKYDSSNLKKENTVKVLKEEEKTPVSNKNGRYRAFLVISNYVDAPEQNSKVNHPAVSGLFQKDTGGNYWPKANEYLRFCINCVQKRSAEDKDVSTYHAMKKRGPEIDSKEKKNKAFYSVENFSEEKSKLKPLQLAQRSTKSSGNTRRANRKQIETIAERNKNYKYTPRQIKVNTFFSKVLNRFLNRRSMTDLEGNQDSLFFTEKKLINRKSVFPPSSDSNIIRDSRNVNEETSEYHSQRIVDAILSKVSENSKFKELIAPGLAVRTPTYKEGIDSKNKATSELRFSEELQSFLQKFKFDLENLAEQHFKKRMCNKINRDLKQFLQSLLSISEENVKHNLTNAQHKKCSLSPQMNMPMRKNLSQIDQNENESTQKILADLRKEQVILKKLIENYQNMSKVEKEKLDTQSPCLLKELEQTNDKSKSSKHEPSLTSKSASCEHNSTQMSPTNNNTGLNKEKLQTGNNVSSNAESLTLKPRGPKIQNLKSDSSHNNDLKPVKDTGVKKEVSVFYFSPLNDSNQENMKKTILSSNFEKVITVNDTYRQKNNRNNNNNNNNKIQNHSYTKTFKPKNSTLKSFDSSFQTFMKKPETEIYDSPTKGIENIRIKHSSPNNKRFNKRNQLEEKTDSSSQPLISSKERRRLRIGYAAGVQLALKNRDSRTSSVEFCKSDMNVPGVTTSETLPSQPRDGTQVLQENVIGSLSVEDFKTPKTSTDYYKDYFDESERAHFENNNFFETPFKGINKIIYLPQIKFVIKKQVNGFKSFNERPYFLTSEASLPSRIKQKYILLNFLNNFCDQRAEDCEGKFFKRKILKKDITVPSFLAYYPKGLKKVSKRKDRKIKRLVQ